MISIYQKNLDNSLEYYEIEFKDHNYSTLEIYDKFFDTCTFINCNLSETKFKNCKLINCIFINCNLSSIKINGSDFTESIFEDCKMIGINWTYLRQSSLQNNCPIRFHKCNISHSNFLGLNLKQHSIIDCSAVDCDFRETDLSNTDLSETDFKDSLFNKTNLAKANFTNAINYNISLLNNQVKKARFSLPEAIRLLKHLEIIINE